MTHSALIAFTQTRQALDSGQESLALDLIAQQVKSGNMKFGAAQQSDLLVAAAKANLPKACSALMAAGANPFDVLGALLAHGHPQTLPMLLEGVSSKKPLDILSIACCMQSKDWAMVYPMAMDLYKRQKPLIAKSIVEPKTHNAFFAYALSCPLAADEKVQFLFNQGHQIVTESYLLHFKLQAMQGSLMQQKAFDLLLANVPAPLLNALRIQMDAIAVPCH